VFELDLPGTALMIETARLKGGKVDRARRLLRHRNRITHGLTLLRATR
jgi:hypothetical protein